MNTDKPKIWEAFKEGKWCNSVDVQNFISLNYTPYEGDASFLAEATPRTKKMWEDVMLLVEKEKENNGLLDADVDTPSEVNSHGAGYINKEAELIVGLQTDAPLKRAIMPLGGYRMVETSCKEFGLPVNQKVKEIFTKYRRTHNEGVFNAYTPEILAARKSAIVTGLPDAYGRGRIIGDYRRLALYGIDKLIQDKMEQKSSSNALNMESDIIREREELQDQIIALGDVKKMCASYGFDVSVPATNFKEAVQWTYFAYLAAIKDQNGAAMSIGRTSTFLDIYAEKDIAEGTLTESEAQEIMDDFIIKLRIVRFLRTNDYNQLFSGDPVWVTESIGGMGNDGRTLVTKNCFRALYSLVNLGASPEPNMTVLWSNDMPKPFKDFCAKLSIETSSIQYESDDLMRPIFGDDYAIACCVSPLIIGKEMQFFGARANLAKALLYAINGGVDEKTFAKVVDGFEKIEGDYLEIDEVMAKFDKMMDWLSKVYVDALNIIHYMHDKYYYEKAQMAFLDKDVVRKLGCGIAGFSVVVDSLSAIKNAKVKIIRNEAGLAVDFVIEGDFPKYGNDDEGVDAIASELVKTFMQKIMKLPTYRNAVHTQSILTITSNVVYGKKTGNTPDGRKAGEPFAPGANPFHQRDTHGALCSLCSVAKLPFQYAKDGISNTFSIFPHSLGKEESERIDNLIGLIDGYVAKGGQHLNVNVLEKTVLKDAMEHPEKYPQLTVRVSGYAVNFVKLTREQQLDVISRTFHEKF